jgi:phosphoglycolate phosphatase
VRLVLFDIDGTLLSCGRVAREACADAVSEALGRTVDLEDYSMSGKTDPQILRELMERAGASAEEVARLMPAARDAYVRNLHDRLRPEHVVPKPGVQALVSALAERADVVLGLLTGNLESCARLKIDPLGLNPRFPFGAYGSDHADRYCLVPIALQRAREHTGIAFVGPQTVVIGDTIHDVLCGRALAVRAVAVATGHQSRQRLAESGPHALLDDFSDIQASLDAILG